ncbi:DUF4235 domain-containing protein [Phytomonospora endophytica]|uniref:Putative metal-dependent enzyme (Double-stranded beta helix superfamily) n=1 Tax=Phytomonospora endophytica TaxID=714109 RepID=A0A841FYG3_9ACTN|nr:DUF4235 domain-containing protein [Phytomonospora endophytica]MBB6039783.1 putative metal-dependent enzyme (double-stranded beta helix superfamily) [Phytomonospora endophytica]GIG70881.1 hypothetical protein Pen01_71760 [Phytomonospora endophytica]
MKNLLYKPFGLIAGVAGGLVAGWAFKQVWRLSTGDDDAPDATDADKGWGEILTAAALQGAIFAIVKAAIDRGGAAGVRRLSGGSGRR